MPKEKIKPTTEGRDAFVKAMTPGIVLTGISIPFVDMLIHSSDLKKWVALTLMMIPFTVGTSIGAIRRHKINKKHHNKTTTTTPS